MSEKELTVALGVIRDFTGIDVALTRGAPDVTDPCGTIGWYFGFKDKYGNGQIVTVDTGGRLCAPPEFIRRSHGIQST